MGEQPSLEERERARGGGGGDGGGWKAFLRLHTHPRDTPCLPACPHFNWDKIAWDGLEVAVRSCFLWSGVQCSSVQYFW